MTLVDEDDYLVLVDNLREDSAGTRCYSNGIWAEGKGGGLENVGLWEFQIADICHNQQWCNFFPRRYPFVHRERQNLAYFGYFVSNLRTFTGLDNVVVSQN